MLSASIHIIMVHNMECIHLKHFLRYGKKIIMGFRIPVIQVMCHLAVLPEVLCFLVSMEMEPSQMSHTAPLLTHHHPSLALLSTCVTQMSGQTLF